MARRRKSRKKAGCRVISTPAGRRCLCKSAKKTRFAKMNRCKR